VIAGSERASSAAHSLCMTKAAISVSLHSSSGSPMLSTYSAVKGSAHLSLRARYRSCWALMPWEPLAPWSTTGTLASSRSVSRWQASACVRCAFACRCSTSDPGALPALVAAVLPFQNFLASLTLTLSQSLALLARVRAAASAVGTVFLDAFLPTWRLRGSLSCLASAHCAIPPRLSRTRDALACMAVETQCSLIWSPRPGPCAALDLGPSAYWLPHTANADANAHAMATVPCADAKSGESHRP
jgi:hypothetical protein